MAKVLSKFANFAGPLDYWLLDADPAAKGVSNAIWCNAEDCPAAETDSIDVTFSHYVIEHIPHPWKAIQEMARMTKPGGLALHAVPWSYHYHATPGDYFRFSHSGIESLFVDAGFKVLDLGYDLCSKRPTFKSIDEHFDEIWLVYIVAQKL